MVSIRALLVLAVLAAVATEARQEHEHVRSGDSMALVLSPNAVEDATAADDSCDFANGQGCQRQLKGQEDAPPEFIPTHEWQDILPNQAVPPGLYIRINLETGKKEAKFLE